MRIVDLGRWVLPLMLLAASPVVSFADEPAKIEAAPKGFDAKRDEVAKGSVETLEYDSKATGSKRKAQVYLPAGYSKDSGTKYPVLYLLHGSGDDETGWVVKGSADVILDNVIADKKAVPMIVVMPNGFAAPAGDPPANDGASEEERRRAEQRRRTAAFEPDLINDLMPAVEAKYATINDKDHRAIFGLSMGAGQAFRVGFRHLDKFAYVGGFSGLPFAGGNRGGQDGQGGNRGDAPQLDVAGIQKLKLLWLSTGETDAAKERIDQAHARWDEMQIPHVYHVEAGGHQWPVWKNDLYLISPRLFR